MRDTANRQLNDTFLKTVPSHEWCCLYTRKHHLQESISAQQSAPKETRKLPKAKIKYM